MKVTNKMQTFVSYAASLIYHKMFGARRLLKQGAQASARKAMRKSHTTEHKAHEALTDSITALAEAEKRSKEVFTKAEERIAGLKAQTEKVKKNSLKFLVYFLFAFTLFLLLALF
mmetsp:Transcript_57915/g.131241  ORF Transcript_57915/g.131241 Transcript_57915/m.131241 type:complete len:115 (+) Transcript_57915:134-478(+)